MNLTAHQAALLAALAEDGDSRNVLTERGLPRAARVTVTRTLGARGLARYNFATGRTEITDAGRDALAQHAARAAS